MYINSSICKLYFIICWICSKQYQEITYEDYENLSLNEFPKVLNSNATVESLVNKEIIPISTGSTLPFFNNGIIKIRNEKFRFKKFLRDLIYRMN